ncbi:MAG: ATPase domain-containing protein [Candidatus Bathyarchaeia archaeon]
MRVISLGIAELDRDLGGGIPHPSLISIEGDYGSGKTIFIQQIVSAMLKEGLRVYVISSEATVKEYLAMMKSVKLNVDDYYLSGKLNIYPLHVEGARWNDFLSSFFLRVTSNFLELKKRFYDVVVIDSLSVLTVNTPAPEFLTFVTRMKNLVSDDKTIIVTFHPEFLSEETIMKLRASSDVYLVLKNASISGIDVKILRIVKLWGVGGERKSAITLEISPHVGLRVMPLGGVKI